jgi:IS5 family transposase
MTLAHQAEFQRYSKKIRCEQFLEEMDAVIPWADLFSLVAPRYSKGEMGRKPVGLNIMLRVYFLQQWLALSDESVEDALCESPVLRRFAGIDLGRAPVPDETTLLNFRHLLEEHDLGGQMLDAVNLYPASLGIRITTGTNVDATIIYAPSSTKNEKRERDLEMHQTRKGNPWHFGAKAHIGVDSKGGLCIRCEPRRRAFPMFTCRRICCTVTSGRSGATQVTRDRPRRLVKPRLPPRTSPAAG